MSACSAACGYCGRCTGGGRLINATCPQCGTDFYKGRDDLGALCDRCCDERDYFAAEDRRMAQAILSQKAS